LICCAAKVWTCDFCVYNVRVAHIIPPGKQLVFVTNNSTKSRADYKKKFDKMGITASEVC
jgi:4-nitrophenyl phosphatase